MIKLNIVTFLLVQIYNIYKNSESGMKDLKNDTKIYHILRYTNTMCFTIQSVFDNSVFTFSFIRLYSIHKKTVDLKIV